MEDLIFRYLDETKIRFDLTALVRIAVIFVLTAAVLIALTVLYKRLRKKLEGKRDLRKVHTARIVFRLVRVFVIVTALVAALQALGINLIGLSAALALLALLLVLAIKDALQDLFAGFVIVSDKFFNVGDAVEFEGREGIVVSFTARTTKIELLEDRSVLSVANRHVSKIRKLTHLVDVDLPLPYEMSGREAKDVLQDVCRRIEDIPGVEAVALKGTQDFGASAILYKIRFFCKPNDRPDIRRAVLGVIQEGLEEKDVHIPYQQIDIHER